jgi:DNA-binding response OmpR family regulator
MTARILIVEDDPDVATLVRHSLERAGHTVVDVVANGAEALHAVRRAPPDLLILDLALPGLDGFDVCRALRARPPTAALPIIVLTARTAEADRVAGLQLGADDYITKPFSLRELAARVEAVLRRARAPAGPASSAVYRGRLLHVDFEAVAVAVGDRPVRLTRREFELLRALVESRPRVVSRARLLERVWGDACDVDARSVDVHIGRLRAKLGAARAHIETVVGVGYRFVE